MSNSLRSSIHIRALFRRGFLFLMAGTVAVFLLVALHAGMSGRVLAQEGGTITITKETTPAGGEGFPFTLDPGAVSFISKWGSYGGEGGEFYVPRGVALDAAGNFYVTDTSSRRIQKFNNDGDFLLAWGWDVVAGGDTGFEVCNTAANCKIGSSGSGDGQFNFPSGVAVDAAGNVYVADSGNNRIQKFNDNGTYLGQWGGLGVEKGQFDFPTGVVVDAAGNVYVADYNNKRIQKFNGDGDFLLAWGWDVVDGGDTDFEVCTADKTCKSGVTGSAPGQFNSPRGVAVDAAGNVYVTDRGNHRIQKFDGDGNYLGQWGGFGSGNGEFYLPTGITVDAAGNVYVVDTDNNRIQKFDSEGNYLIQWGSWGSSDGQFYWPEGVTVDAAGNVYVADTSKYSIQVFSQSGVVLNDGQSHAFTGLEPGEYLLSELVPDGWRINGVTCFGIDSTAQRSGNTLKVTMDAGGTLDCTIRNEKLASLTITKQTTPAGGEGFPFTLDPGAVSFVRKWGSNGGKGDELNIPRGVALDAAGNFYVADNNNNRIQKFNNDGDFLLAWGWDVVAGGDTGFEVCNTAATCKTGSSGSGDGQFYFPLGVAVDAAGNVYVADANNYRIQKFNDDGTYLGQWGGPGVGKGQFNYPTDVAVDAAGNVYVAEHVNQRIQKFNGDGDFLLAWGWDVVAGGDTDFEVCTPDKTCKIGVTGSAPGQFNTPRGVAVDAAGNVYVTDTNNNRIQKFDGDGNYLGQWGGLGSGNGAFYLPIGIAVDAAGNVYVADSYNNRIQKFDSEGNYLIQWGNWGSNDGQFNFLHGVTVDAAGNVYVSDTHNDRIQVFSQQSGVVLNDGQSHAFTGLEPGEYLLSELVPDGWAVDDIVCDGGNPQVQGNTMALTLAAGNDVECTYSNNGQANLTITKQTTPAGGEGFSFTLDPGAVSFVRKWGSNGGEGGEFYLHRGVALDAAGNFYVADTNNHRIQKFDNDGDFLLAWGWDVVAGGDTGFEVCNTAANCKTGSYGSGDGQFISPLGVAVDAAGNVYVADLSNHRIQKFNDDGTYLGQWGGLGVEKGQFDNPSDVAVDAAGNVYVPDYNNKRIQKFNGDGDFLLAWGWDVVDGGDTGFEVCTPDKTCKTGVAGNAAGQFYLPRGVAVDAAGNVYVAEHGNHRIQKFDGDGNYLGQWGGFDSGNGKFNYPTGIAVDAAGNVYVADSYNYRIQKFDSEGNYLIQWYISDINDGIFDAPFGVAVDAAGNVYVADTFNDRIQVFSQSVVVLNDGQSHAFTGLEPGEYTVSELVPDAWAVDDIVCNGGNPQVQGNTVALTLAAGNDVECTFTNEADLPPAEDAIYLSAKAAGSAGSLAFGPEDILKWDGSDWTTWFDGSAALPGPKKPKHNVNAFWIPDSEDDDVVMSFAQNSRKVPGITGKVDGTDLVRWDGDTFSLYFDGSDVGLTKKTPEKIDGLHVLDGAAAPDEFLGGCVAYLLISTQGPAQVPNFTGGVLKAGGEDVLGFCATNLGDDTAGFWHMVFDGSAAGLKKNTTDSISVGEDGETLYLTTKKAVNLGGGVVGGHSMVFAYDLDAGAWSGPHFSAPANGLNRQVDGLQVVGELGE